LNARTAILAAANPVESKYNAKKSVVENIKLPPTLLSRFDLIYLILDHQSEAADRRLANHIVSLYSQPSEADMANIKRHDGLSTQLIATNTVPRDFLAKYISYARKYAMPKLSDAAADALIREYT
jgi:DNA replication licensing factor MCM4